MPEEHECCYRLAADTVPKLLRFAATSVQGCIDRGESISRLNLGPSDSDIWPWQIEWFTNTALPPKVH